MDEDFQAFLHSQFSEAHENAQSEISLSELIDRQKERYGKKYPIAEGAQKKVFKCKDLLTGRSIAYATVKDSQNNESTAKFIREARLSAHLEHPHIIPVYDTGLDDEGIPYFTMKYISGQNFEDYLKENHDLQSKIDILIKICEAIRFAHSKGVIHFDIKPDNIQVSDYGEVLLCDWGLAGIAYESCSQSLLDDDILKQVDLSQSIDLYFKGTAGYAAPEMWEKNTHRNHLCDIYSLGAVLYQLLTGKKPEQKMKIDSLEGPQALQAVCRKALSADKENRYQSSGEFLSELLAWRNGFATQAEEASFATNLKLLILRHKNVSISVITSLFLIVLLALIFILSLQEKERRASALANILQKTEQDRQNLEKELEPKYLEKAEAAFNRREYDASIALCEHVLRYSPDSKEALRIKGWNHFSRLEFKEAIPCLEGELKELAKEYLEKSIPLSVGEIIDLVTSLDRSDRRGQMIIYKNILYEAFNRNRSVEEKKKLMIAELKYKNRKLEDINLNLQETAEGWIIDLSNNPDLADIWILQKLGPIHIKSLNVSDTRIGTFDEIFDNMQIEKFIYRNSRAKKFAFLENRRMLHIDIQGSRFDLSQYIANMPLITLNIANTPFRNWPVLFTLKFLKKLTVSKGELPKKIRQALGDKVEIIEI